MYKIPKYEMKPHTHKYTQLTHRNEGIIYRNKNNTCRKIILVIIKNELNNNKNKNNGKPHKHDNTNMEYMYNEIISIKSSSYLLYKINFFFFF